MSTSSEMNERHGRILAKLSELSLTLAVDLHTRALAAEDADEVAELANAFQKIARGLRQTMALEAKLARDAQTAAREAAVEDERTRPTRIAERADRVCRLVEPLIWNELEKPEQDMPKAINLVTELIDDHAAAEDFLDAPIETLVELLKGEILELIRDGVEASDFEEPPLQNTG